ncbi:MAG: DUF5690 family protein [Limisphaerales bacterium]
MMSPLAWTPLRAPLARAPLAGFALFAAAAAFLTYFSMYAFRKPFAAAKFSDESFLGTEVALKTALVIAQVIGYACSKYLGIKVCSEATPGRRAATLVLLVLAAELALVLFGLLPGGWKVVAIFLNGLPLGMVWGLVVGYLEGRRCSDVLLAGLCASFILSSGVVKDVGRALINAQGWLGATFGPVSESWMPAVTGLLFLPLFLVSVWLLQQLPPPGPEDIAARAERFPMAAVDRRRFLRSFLPGMVLLIGTYLLLTAYRDYRDNYQVEIFDGLGYGSDGDASLITRAEMLVAAGVIASLAFLNLFRDNRRGLLAALGVMIAGMIVLLAGTAAWRAGWVNGFWWVVLTGLGSYLAYVPYNAMLFDRLVASTRFAGTAVFAIYVADAVGYTGSVAVQLYKDLGRAQTSRLAFFEDLTWVLGGGGAVALAAAWVYFARRTRAKA